MEKKGILFEEKYKNLTEKITELFDVTNNSIKSNEFDINIKKDLEKKILEFENSCDGKFIFFNSELIFHIVF
jgi:hypothetical protein